MVLAICVMTVIVIIEGNVFNILLQGIVGVTKASLGNIVTICLDIENERPRQAPGKKAVKGPRNPAAKGIKGHRNPAVKGYTDQPDTVHPQSTPFSIGPEDTTGSEGIPGPKSQSYSEPNFLCKKVINCKNGGTCSSIGYSWFCSCKKDFSGQLCEIRN
ncbi:DgyrCDS14700 [Dimorphilus gyrociliatus]|uniref:DgyrCDS14700 n=1 Tax=Dimorphilus gyrociliatus TaxID=2664684 RepID=A0A7I8WEH5_9ANNE|nr:DgyrCDS14700 [Dimorphilus gyrociliatus]